MTVRKFQPRREITLTKTALVQFLGLSFWGRWRWLLFGWRTFEPRRNTAMRYALRAERTRLGVDVGHDGADRTVKQA